MECGTPGRAAATRRAGYAPGARAPQARERRAKRRIGYDAASGCSVCAAGAPAVRAGEAAAVGEGVRGSSCRSQCAGLRASRTEYALFGYDCAGRSPRSGLPARCRQAGVPRGTQVVSAGAGVQTRATARARHCARDAGMARVGRGAGAHYGRARHRGGRREARRRRRELAETLRPPQDTLRRRPRERGPEADWRPALAPPRGPRPRAPPNIDPRRLHALHPHVNTPPATPHRPAPRCVPSLILNPYLCAAAPVGARAAPGRTREPCRRTFSSLFQCF
ncbi:unnamed protein product [Euphydryas editha]|uniref:Uncharacterized protein n=1 Tax=Euphydryas editha TaxID=104508 RepID=A0AAU9UER7_EUPED|nr:unnamed protein product [Euphydryas editha]